MRGEPSIALDLEAFREAAGDKMFARGEDYHLNGQVELLGVMDGRVLARAYGQDVYAVQVELRTKGFAGRCTCPAHEEWGVCKHMVATALAWNGGADETTLSQQMASMRQRLDRMPRDSLIQIVLEAVARDETLWTYLMGEAD